MTEEHTTHPTTVTAQVYYDPFTKLTEGSIVHYVLPSGRGKGEHRPAIVVRNWRQSNGLVQLQVFTDGVNDFEASHPASSGLFWATSVHYSASYELGTWHWLEE